MIVVRNASIASRPFASCLGSPPIALAKSFAPPAAIPISAQVVAITSVTSGPATATRNSTPGEGVSRVIFAIPPKSQRSIPAIGIRLRIATHECPSSWRRIDAKKRRALAVASRNAPVELSPGIASW